MFWNTFADIFVWVCFVFGLVLCMKGYIGFWRETYPMMKEYNRARNRD